MTDAARISYEDRMRGALKDGQSGDVEKIVREAFANPEADEGALAWVAAVAAESKFPWAAEFLVTFINRFPASLHLPRIYLADILAGTGRFDDATEHARQYLRLAKESEVFATLGSTRFLRHGVSHAFLLLTAAYTDLGARSYSERVLKHALGFDLDPKFADSIKQELSRLAGEMRDPTNKATNDRWNAFFASGSGADGLFDMCKSRGFPILAKRVDLLEGNFRFNSQFEVGEAEMYMLIITSTDNASGLL